MLGILLIVFSQFTGLYYFFDDANRYHRGPGFLLCYLFPLVAPVIILTVVVRYRNRLARPIVISIYIFIIAPIVASIVQIFAYGLSLTNITIVGASAVVYIVALFDLNKRIERANRRELEFLREEHENMNRLFEQTVSVFVNAIDEKYKYTKGHSVRVAKYARAIAEACGKGEKECERVFQSALLHDVGKMEIPDSVIEKGEDLTDEEKETMRQIPVIGDKMLAQITDYPYLRQGARYAYERYDGSGYPEHLKGDQIPEIARIIAVADCYDDMTTGKHDRDPFPQIIVREEFIKKAGVLYDPRFASVMVTLMDSDRNYTMQQKIATPKSSRIECEGYRSSIAKGILIEDTITYITFKYSENKTSADDFSSPSLILYDSYDGRIHDDEKSIEAFRYIEYGEIWFDGNTVSTGARNMEASSRDVDPDVYSGYRIAVGRFEDHVRVKLTAPGKITEVILALPDSSKYAYLGITGEHCIISDINIDRTENRVNETDIPRIVSRLTYTDAMEGDLPNLQIDRTRSASTDGVRVTDGMKMIFHTMSLPSSHLVWHCPYILLYSSDDKKVGGKNYRELALIKMNGENECTDRYANNSIEVERTGEFTNWDAWKEANKNGLEIEVKFSVRKNTVTVSAEDSGIVFTNTMTLKEECGDVYVSLTGDQCAMTGIRIHRD